jgi:N-methylhydantoinase A
LRLGVDIGGTFTDFVLQDGEGALRRWKAPSTPPDFESGVFAGIEHAARELGMEPAALLADIDELLHGTTVTTNVILTRAGARVGLLTTRGFGDLYGLARMYRNHERDPSKVTHPVPLVPRADVGEVLERIDYRGRVIVPIDRDGLREEVRAMLARGIRSFAICFLWSFRNPAHERVASEVILEEEPDAFVAASFEASPLIGEYERMSTAAISAFGGPELRAYTVKLLDGLRERGFGGSLLLMKSDGGLGSIDNTIRSAGQTIYSGPVAGATAARALGDDSLITFDMGGTSTDVALVEDGELRTTSLQFLDRQALAIPMVDVTTVGAGGGSLASVGPDGALRVGPQSAGARPGPACYGRGGTEPTVTDANVVLGLIDPRYFLGGEMPLDAGAADAAIGGLATELSLDTVAAAAGVFRVVNALMADAVRLRTVFAGLDPRGFTLVSYGGAGGLHCTAVARELGIRQVVVPAFASVFSAAGLISTDLVYSAARSTQVALPGGGEVPGYALAGLRELFDELERQAGGLLAAHRIPDEARELRRSLEMSYAGQILNFEIDLPGGALLEAGDLTRASADFDRRYVATYGTGAAAPEAGYQIKRCRVTGVGRVPRPAAQPAVAGGSGAAQPVTRRTALGDDRSAKLVELDVYRGGELGPGARLAGPAIVEYADSNVLVPAASEASVDARLNLTIEVGS